MHKQGDEIHETGDEAREAVDVKGMTTVVTVSIILAVVVLIGVFFFFR